MGLLIDSSVLISTERGQLHLPELLAEKGELSPAIAAITASELLHGVHRADAAHQEKRRIFVEGILQSMIIIPFDLPLARVHAKLSASLASAGQAVGLNDLIIAATAISLDLFVLTRDLRSFPRIPGLNVIAC